MLSVGTTGLQISFVWLFLERMTESLTKGTNNVYDPGELRIDPAEVAEGGLEFVMKAVKLEEDYPGLPALNPALHLLKAFLDYLKRDSAYIDRLDKQWEDTESSIFVAAYFNWWSNGGASEFEQIARDGETMAEYHKQELVKLTATIAPFGNRLTEFEEKYRQYEQLKGGPQS